MPSPSAVPLWGPSSWRKGSSSPCLTLSRAAWGGKTIGLFGSYGWGDGEWMRTWAEECEGLGCKLADQPVIAHEAPDADAADACRDLGKALVS